MKDVDVDIAHLEALAEDLAAAHRRLLKALVAHRKAHKLTQLEVAERMGVSQPVVSDFERYDANPTLSTVRRYALAIGAGIENQVVDRCRSATTFTTIVGDLQPAWQDAAPALTWSQPATLEAHRV